jgi:hypothetical protein
MTPIEDVFTLGEDQILGPDLVQKVSTLDRLGVRDGYDCLQIAEAGYSRIPVHAKGDLSNFKGMLLCVAMTCSRGNMLILLQGEAGTYNPACLWDNSDKSRTAHLV